MQYQPRQFNLPTLQGISEKQIKVHLALYEGYVKHVNLIRETLATYATYGDKASEGDKLAIAELRRRFAFEFDGMRMHEHYFEQFEPARPDDSGRSGGGGATALSAGGALAKLATEKYGELGLVGHIKEVAGTRGIGWVVVYYDKVGAQLHTVFVADHELGQLAGLPIILALDLWEHAYMVDYVPAEKKNYIQAFFENLNWSVVEARLARAL
jgi:superoxide dismutase, Fe-Mn family